MGCSGTIDVANFDLFGSSRACLRLSVRLVSRAFRVWLFVPFVTRRCPLVLSLPTILFSSTRLLATTMDSNDSYQQGPQDHQQPGHHHHPQQQQQQHNHPAAGNRSLVSSDKIESLRILETHTEKSAISRYPFLQHPTNANLGQWAASAAPAITGHQAAALLHHTQNHATGVATHLSSQGVTPTTRENRVQTHLAFLRNHWPNGRWHPPNCTPTTDPPPLDVLTPMVTLTEHWESHAGGRPLSDLWAPSPVAANRGLLWQIVDANRARSLTRRVAEAALRRVKVLFPAPAPLAKQPAAALPQSEAKPDPEKPRAAQIVAAVEDFAPSPLRQIKPDPGRDGNHIFSPEHKRNRTPSPPPMPDDGNESDVSLDGVLGDLFAQPGIPLAPTTKKYKKIRETGLALAKKTKEKAEASARRRSSAEEKAAAAIAEAASFGKEGLGADKIDEVAKALGDAASKAVSRVAKRQYAHLLPPGQRAVMTKRARRRIEDMVSEYL